MNRMLDLAKLYRCLYITLACLFVFATAAMAVEKYARNISDTDALKLIGAEPAPNPPGPQKQINTGKNERSPGTGFENSPLEIRIHTVQAGDSLSIISKRYYDDAQKVDLIAEYNHIKNIDRLKVGQKIKIPIFELKPPAQETGFQEKNLAGSDEIASSHLGETDLKTKGITPKKILLAVIFLIIVCLGLLVFLLYFKRSEEPAAAADPEPFEIAPFVWGKVEDLENSDV